MACALVTAGAPQSATAASWPQVSWGGNLAVTSDFIYRGLSQSSGSAALQADLHADTPGGAFGGVWASTRAHDLDPYAGYDLELYLGPRARAAPLAARLRLFPHPEAGARALLLSHRRSPLCRNGELALLTSRTPRRIVPRTGFFEPKPGRMTPTVVKGAK